MNFPQQRLQSAIDQVRDLLPERVRNVGFEHYAEQERRLFPPSEGRAQAAATFTARKGVIEMVIMTSFNVADSDPTSHLLGDELSLRLRDTKSDVTAGQAVSLTRMPGIGANGIPQFVLADQEFAQAVHLAESDLEDRRAKKSSEARAPNLVTFQAFARASGKTIARFEFDRGPRPRHAADIHQWEYVRLYFTDGSMLEISTGSNAAQVAALYPGLKAEAFSADLMALFHNDGAKAGRPQ